MALDDLLRSRNLLRYGVGQTTQRNEVLPFPPLDIEIPARVGRVKPFVQKTVAPDTFDALGPLTETLYSDRSYYPDRRWWSSDGLFSLPLRPIKTIKVTTADVPPKTLQFSLSDAPTAATILDGALTEISRTYTATDSNRKFKIVTDFWVAFDARLDEITFRRVSKLLKLILYPLGPSVPIPYGSIFGTHTAWFIALTSYKLMSFFAKTSTTAKRFALILKSPGKLLEHPIEDAALSAINASYNGSTYLQWPWNMRPKAWGMSRGFKTLDGKLWTDETMTKRADFETYPTFSNPDQFNSPRYFKFSAVENYKIPGTDITLTNDAIFNNKNSTSTFLSGPAGISDVTKIYQEQHLFKCDSGPVWLITVSVYPGTGPTDQYRVELSQRYDRLLDPTAGPFSTMAVIDATNYGNIWSFIPVMQAIPSPPLSNPTKRPVKVEIQSRSDGKVAYILGYWDNGVISLTNPRKLTSIIRLDFSEVGIADPNTGAGITVVATQIPVLTSWTTSAGSHSGSTLDTNFTITSESLGFCGANEMFLSKTQYMTSSDFSKQGTISNDSYNDGTVVNAIYWIYADNVDFKIITIESSYLKSGYTNSVDTYFHDTWQVPSCVDGSIHVTGENHDVATYTISSDITETNTSKLKVGSGLISESTMVMHSTYIKNSYSDPGTSTFTSTDSYSGNNVNIHELVWGRDYIYPQNRLNTSNYYPSPNKVFHGYSIPSATDNYLVCVDPRHDRAYIAPSAATSGAFF